MRVAVIGLGAAGANAARTIVAERPEAEVTVYGAEPHLYYARPKLPALLAGEAERESLYFYGLDWYRERRIAVCTGAAVERIEPVAHRLVLGEGTAAGYDRLLLATGAQPFVPPIAGAAQPGVFSLWTIEHAAAIRAYAGDCRRAVVIGGGLLGLEAARALRTLGLEVTVLEFAPRLLPRQLDAQGATVLTRHIEGLGIAVRTGAAAERIEGTQRVQAVLLQGGDRLPADLVLIAAGGRPNLALAQAAGLATARGVVVDAHLRTSAEDVYAAGDVAEFEGQVYGIIPAAVEQARVAARNLAEVEAEEYTGTVPSNTLRIAGLDLTSIGEIEGVGEGYTELRHAGSDGRYLKLVLKDDRLRGAILLGHPGKVNPVSRTVKAQVHVGGRRDELLADGFDWKSLLT